MSRRLRIAGLCWVLGALSLELAGACTRRVGGGRDDGPRERVAASERARSRVRTECNVGRPKNGPRFRPQALLRLLADLAQWIDDMGRHEEIVHPWSWCVWRIEMEEGVRGQMHLARAPPIDALPDPTPLVGLERAAILRVLGELDGRCTEVVGHRLVLRPCAEVSELRYPFFHDDTGLVGGAELVLGFDSAGRCDRASWALTRRVIVPASQGGAARTPGRHGSMPSGSLFLKSRRA